VGKKLKRKDVAIHKDECPEESISCEYGCKEKILRKNTDDHFESNLKTHLLSMMKADQKKIRELTKEKNELILLRQEDQKKISQLENEPKSVVGRSRFFEEYILFYLGQWLGGINKIGSLLYKASRDGFGAIDFHKLCDSKGATLTLIESTEGCIFGGYSEVEWKSREDKAISDKSFLFTLKNIHGIGPTKFDKKKDITVIYRYSCHGPTFGGGHDLYICNYSNTIKSSYSNIGNSYIDTTGKGITLFAGSHYFTTKEIEVYQVI